METSGSALLPLVVADVLLGRVMVGWGFGSGSVAERRREILIDIIRPLRIKCLFELTWLTLKFKASNS